MLDLIFFVLKIISGAILVSKMALALLLLLINMYMRRNKKKRKAGT
jgi:hypothetical protein